MAANPDVIRARNRLSAQHQRGRKPAPEVEKTLRQNLATEKIAAYVAEVVAAAPPLRPEQRERIVALLTAGGA
ncbi:hypothetical protein [Pedococcus bigeumensis]|uniref:hypothetical protein n=1 Tax=Pedococcus bigeumensis TaxID=433644 RepID=UPI002FE82BDB